jgi:diguanylate cyclase (GGDEF)-like protein
MISGFSSVTLLFAASGVILLLGFIHFTTGTEYALSLFFLFPIVFSTWYVGIKSGVGMAFFGTITWLVADLLLRGKYSDVNVPFINESFRLIVFLFAAGLVHVLKNALEDQKQIARTDVLTGMSNRMSFFEVAEREMSRARRFNYPLSIIYMDIDNFKFVNDTSGHRSGDRLLQTVADTIQANIRSIDVAARLGGDEMGILLAENDVSGAKALAEKLQKKLAAQMLRHRWPVTFSMGVATFPNIGISVGDMLNVADNLMYIAKKGGKNKIVHQVVEVQAVKDVSEDLIPHI